MITSSPPRQNDIPPTEDPGAAEAFLSLFHGPPSIDGSELHFETYGGLPASVITYGDMVRSRIFQAVIDEGSYSRWTRVGNTRVSGTDLDEVSSFLLAFRELSYAMLATPSLESQTYPLLEPDLKAALQDLEGVIEEAREDEFPEPTSVAISNARRLLNKLYDLSPQRYVVYPMDDGEVVIDGGRPDRRLCVFCNSDGTVSCLGWIDGKRQRAEALSIDSVPTEFLVRSLFQADGYQVA